MPSAVATKCQTCFGYSGSVSKFRSAKCIQMHTNAQSIETGLALKGPGHWTDRDSDGF